MAADDSTQPGDDLTLDPIVRQGKKRWERCVEWERDQRRIFLDDLKFAAGDSDNNFQWPENIRSHRDLDKRPCITINILRQHNLQIINDAKQNKPSIMYRPTGNGATKESSDVVNGLARHVEYISNAQSAYDIATEFQVKGGIGYWRVATDWSDGDSLDQEIFIRPINDPMKVYLDPDIKERDGSDSQFGFIFEDMVTEEFKEAHPKFWEEHKTHFGNGAPKLAFGDGSGTVEKDHIRVVQYFCKEEDEDHIASVRDANGERTIIRKSKIGDVNWDKLVDDPQTRHRMVKKTQVMWYLIAGEKIVDTKKWPGIYIPIVRVIGEETIIEGKLDRKGHTRTLKDAQRMYNYWTSSAIEQVGLQSKIPWIAPAEAIESYETYWKTANTQNHAFLPYSQYIKGTEQKLDAPQRAVPPQMAEAYIKGMAIAREEIMMASGQYQSQLGQPGTERSGLAIQERQRQGDNATYHFIDNLALAIRFTGKILLDLYPKIYDTKRVIQIIAEDGKSLEVKIDPNQAQIFEQKFNENNEVVSRLFNPTLGKYEVHADVGPAYSTRRQEAFNALIQIITQAPNLVGIIGDILLRAADFPLAQDAAQRLENMVPPQAKGQGPSQKEQELMQQVQTLSKLLETAQGQAIVDKVSLKGKDEKRDIDVYEAETNRLKALAAALPIDPEGLQMLVHQLVMEAMSTALSPLIKANAATVGTEPQEGGDPGEVPPGEDNSGAAGGIPPDVKWFVPAKQGSSHYVRKTKG